MRDLVEMLAAPANPIRLRIVAPKPATRQQAYKERRCGGPA